MLKELKSIVEKVVDMKFQEVLEINFDDMSKDRKVKHDDAIDKELELYKSLKETLSENQLKILIEYEGAESFKNSLEQEYMFNRGVMMGLNELSFIREELGSNIVIF